MVPLKPKLSIFTGGKGLGTFYSEQHQVNVKFTEFTIPGTGEDGNTALNWKGKKRVIVVQGAHDGVNFDGDTQNEQLNDFVQEMEDWVGGVDEVLFVQTSAVYTDRFGNTYNVKAFDWTWTSVVTDPNRIVYTLLLHRV